MQVAHLTSNVHVCLVQRAVVLAISLLCSLSLLYNRQYEEKQLKGQQAREEKRLEFANLQQRLQNQLEFEKQKNPASV